MTPNILMIFDGLTRPVIWNSGFTIVFTNLYEYTALLTDEIYGVTEYGNKNMVGCMMNLSNSLHFCHRL